MPQGHSLPSPHNHPKPSQMFHGSSPGAQSISSLHEEHVPRPPPHAAFQPTQYSAVGMVQTDNDPSYQIFQTNVGRTFNSVMIV